MSSSVIVWSEASAAERDVLPAFFCIFYGIWSQACPILLLSVILTHIVVRPGRSYAFSHGFMVSLCTISAASSIETCVGTACFKPQMICVS